MEKKLDTILNHLGNTAVYVIREDNRQILYFNDRVRLVTPGVRVGMVCRELWEGSCENCPVDVIGDEDTKVCINYGDPFGEIVDISATRMEWGEDEVPAFLVSVTPHMQTVEEKEAELRISEQLKKERAFVYDSLPGGVAKLKIGESVTLLEGSKKYFELFGGQEAFKKDGLSGIYWEDRESVGSLFRKCAKRGESISAQYRIEGTLGNIRWVHCLGKEISREGGVPVYQIVILDITQKKKMEIELEQKQMEYQIAVGNAADALFEYFPSQDLLLIHESRGAGGGEYEIKEFLQQLPNLSLTAPGEEKKLAGLIKGEKRKAEVYFRLPDKREYRWILFQAETLKKEDETVKVIGTLRDISDYRLREMELRDQEKLMSVTLDTVIGSAFDEVLFLNLSSGELVMLKSNNRYQGPEEMNVSGFENSFLRSIHPRDRERFRLKFQRDHLKAAFASGRKRVSQEGTRLGKDGVYHWISMEAVCLDENGAGGELVLLLLNTIDEKKRLERETKILYSSLMMMFGEIILLNLETDKYTVRHYDEFTVETMDITKPSGYTEYNLKFGELFVHPDDRAKYFEFSNLQSLRRKIADGGSRFSTEVRRRNGGGEYRWCEMIATVLDREEFDDYDLLLTFCDVHDLRTAKNEMRATQQKFISAVNRFYDGIYEYDLYRDENFTWKGMVDCCFKAGERPDKGSVYFYPDVHPDYRKMYHEKMNTSSLIAAFKEGKGEVSMEIPVLSSGKEYKWFSFTVQRLRDEPGSMRVMVYLKNIHEMRIEEERKRQMLQEALSVAEKSNLAKSDFLSRMSHDIRTPMNAIIGMTAIAKSNLESPEKIEDCLGKIAVSARFLLSLINDVLDMSKIESGKMILSDENFDLYQLIDGIVSICGEQAGQKSQNLRCEIKEGTWRYYRGDALRLEQVLLNLLSNAMKYTPREGQILLSAREDVSKTGGSVIVLDVADNGIGMSGEFLQRLYKPFEQEHTGGGRIFEGSGLGLSITHNLIHMMGGEISVSSEMGKGTIFTVRIPLPKVDSPKAAPIKQPDAETKFSGQKILLVEDSELNREIAQTLLEMVGLTVETAENGLRAVELFSNSEIGYFAAVLMDIRMPVMDGLEATRRIRQLGRADAGKVPIIAMTANAFQEERQEAGRYGMTAYLTKPVETETLYSVLRETLFNGF